MWREIWNQAWKVRVAFLENYCDSNWNGVESGGGEDTKQANSVACGKVDKSLKHPSYESSLVLYIDPFPNSVCTVLSSSACITVKPWHPTGSMYSNFTVHVVPQLVSPPAPVKKKCYRWNADIFLSKQPVREKHTAKQQGRIFTWRENYTPHRLLNWSEWRNKHNLWLVVYSNRKKWSTPTMIDTVLCNNPSSRKEFKYILGLVFFFLPMICASE